MRRLLCRIGLLLSGVAACSAIASAAESGFLERRGTELYLDGKPFYEISFNKFDLVWQLVAAESKTKGFGEDPASSAEEALREMHELGFKTFRAFCGMFAHYFDTAKRDTYVRALDRMLALCDGYDLRVVFCLNVTGCVAKDHGETLVDLVARPESASRRRLEEFVRAVVTRYRDREAVGMWEHENELLLMADIGGKQRLWNGQAVPALPEVAKFHADLAGTALLHRRVRCAAHATEREGGEVLGGKSRMVHQLRARSAAGAAGCDGCPRCAGRGPP